MPRRTQHRRTLIGAVFSAVVAASLLAPVIAEAAPTGVVAAQTVGDTLFPHQGNGGYDVGNYDLDISWASTNVITAVATITATSTQQPLEQFSLDLEGLTVSAVQVNGINATFSRIASGPKFKLVITPATPVSGTFTTKVTYGGTPVTHADPDGSSEGWVATTDGAIALNEPVGSMTWFPNNNTPRDKATFTTRVTVPYAGLPVGNVVAVSNGVLTSTTTAASTRTFTWTQPNQQATYLAVVGIGQYAAAEADVALTTGSTHDWSYRDTALPNAAAGFTTARGKLSAILTSIERHYGSYPGAATGVLVDQVPSGVNYALETQDRPFFPTTIDESTLVHELAHQWFGNQVSPTDWSDVWLNEGPATYIETQVGAALYGGRSTQDTYYDTWNTSTTASLWSVPSAGFTDNSKLFDSQVYTRGAVALEALRSALGDRVFTRAMSTYLQTYSGGSATTAQFIEVAESVSGYDLTAFFATWIYGTTKPAAWPTAYELSLTSNPVAGSRVGPDSTVSYTLRAANSGKVSTRASTVEVDATSLLAQGTLGALPGGVTRSGNTLVWAVPPTAVGATAATTLTATIDHPTSGPVTVTTRGRTLGADCGICHSTIRVAASVVVSGTPTVSGPARTDRTLTVSPGTWDLAATLRYQWYAGGVALADATATTYRVRPSDVGTRLAVTVTGRRAGYTSAARTSAPVTARLAVQTRRPRPTITGQAIIGRTLHARPGAHDAGARLRYRWFVGSRSIPGATRTTYEVRPRDRGKRVTVAVGAAKPGYVTTVKHSVPTQRVRSD